MYYKKFAPRYIRDGEKNKAGHEVSKPQQFRKLRADDVDHGFGGNFIMLSRTLKRNVSQRRILGEEEARSVRQNEMGP